MNLRYLNMNLRYLSYMQVSDYEFTLCSFRRSIYFITFKILKTRMNHNLHSYITVTELANLHLKQSQVMEHTFYNPSITLVKDSNYAG